MGSLDLGEIGDLPSGTPLGRLQPKTGIWPDFLQQKQERGAIALNLGLYSY